MGKTFKKVLIISLSVTAVLAIVLGIHIYMVTKPRIDEKTLSMARMDMASDINQQDAEKIASWLYRQAGVAHVLCNAESNTVVFTFYPAKASANDITAAFNQSFPYKASRYMPDPKAMQSGCPVSVNTFSGKVSSLFKSII